jgi:methylmalonyl-CoA mutase C-terminal domain/subunit
VTAAIHEDVDVLGVSILSGAHMTVFPRIIDLLTTQGVVDEILLLGGGVIPDEDVVTLKGLGVAEILGQETTPDHVVETVRRLVARRQDGERSNHEGCEPC